MSIGLLQIKKYDNYENSIHNLTFYNNFAELNNEVISNYYCINLIHKLFSNVKANEIEIAIHQNKQINEIIFNQLDEENKDSNRNNIIDISRLIYSKYENNIMKNKLSIVGDCPNAFTENFLGIEYVLLKKVQEQLNDKCAELTPYAERLINLAENLYDKSFKEISVDEKFIQKILDNQLENIKSLEKTNKSITEYLEEINLIEKKINKKENELKELIERKDVELISFEKDIIKIEEEKKKYLRDKLSNFDKTKIAFFSYFGITNIEDITLLKYEKKLIENIALKNINDSKKLKETFINSEAQTINKRILFLKSGIEESKNQKEIIFNHLNILKKEFETLNSKLIDTKNIENNIEVLQKRSISELGKEDVFFVHMLPSFQPRENSPFQNDTSIECRANTIRIFNPSISCSSYKLDGTPFLNSTFGDGKFGVILSKGYVGTIKNGDNGTIVLSDGERRGNVDYATLKEELNEVKARENKGNSYNEANISHSVPYGYISILDKMYEEKYFKNDDESFYKKEIQITPKEIFNAYNQLKKLNDIAIENGMNALPLIFMIDGKILEINSKKFNNIDNIEKQLNRKQAIEFIEENFYIEKEIKKINDINNINDNISDEVRKAAASQLISKFKPYLHSALENKISNKIGLKV